MRFTYEQRFTAPRDSVLRAYVSPALYESMHGFEHVDRPDVLAATHAVDHAVVRVRYRFIADVPAAALRFIDPSRLTWVDETRYDFVRHCATTVLRPDHYPDRLSATATSRFDPDGDGTIRRIQGEVKVRIPLLGGKVERAMIEGLEDHMRAEAEFVNRHLAG